VHLIHASLKERDQWLAKIIRTRMGARHPVAHHPRARAERAGQIALPALSEQELADFSEFVVILVPHIS